MGVVALACGLLQFATGLQLMVFLDGLSSGHSHAVVTVIDGSHVDLIYSHDTQGADRHSDADAVGAHLSGDPSQDHVVHTTRDDAPVTRRIEMPDASAVTLAVLSPVPVLRPVASPPPLQRAVHAFSRRSVVLRI